MIYVLAIFLLWRQYELRQMLKSLRVDVNWLSRRVTHLEVQVEELEEDATPLPSPQVEFYELVDGQEKRITMKVIKVSQRLPINVKFKDLGGNIAPVEGKPAWSVTDETLGKVEPADDGLSALFTPAGPVGTLQVQVSADADLGEGVKSILGELEIQLLPGDAAVVELTAGDAQDI
jgi:hypothetical protein